MKARGIVAAVVALALGVGLYVWFSDPAQSDRNVFEASAPPLLPPAAPPAETFAETFKDTSMLTPPAGAKVAIYEFDDLECPFCARAYPIVHAAATDNQVPLIHHDYPLTEIHTWSFDAAVTARYLEDKVSPALAEKYRSDVFTHQNDIASQDDLVRYTSIWFQQQGRTMPFAIDMRCTDEVRADRALGDRIGVRSTPCIFVVTERSRTYVRAEDIDKLSQIVAAAVARTDASADLAPDTRRRG